MSTFRTGRFYTDTWISSFKFAESWSHFLVETILRSYFHSCGMYSPFHPSPSFPSGPASPVSGSCRHLSLQFLSWKNFSFSPQFLARCDWVWCLICGVCCRGTFTASGELGLIRRKNALSVQESEMWLSRVCVVVAFPPSREKSDDPWWVWVALSVAQEACCVALPSSGTRGFPPSPAIQGRAGPTSLQSCPASLTKMWNLSLTFCTRGLPKPLYYFFQLYILLFFILLLF